MKKKLSEWKSKFTDEQYTKLEGLTTNDDADQTYSLKELKVMLGDDTKEETANELMTWAKDKLNWAKENWLLLLLGVFFVSFIIYLLKKIWVYIFRE